MALRGARPVQWLLDSVPVDERWTLVHATHLDEEEVRDIAGSGATVAICTTTEANLGDGFFPLRDYLDAGGRWGVGSDSNSSVDPVEELRWLEYGQRLRAQRRNIASSVRVPSVGVTLLNGVHASAADSTGFDVEDRIVLDADAPVLAGATDADVVDRWLFSGNRPLVRDVEVAGVRVVEDGRHRDRDAIAAGYRRRPGRCSGSPRPRIRRVLICLKAAGRGCEAHCWHAPADRRCFHAVARGARRVRH